MNQLYFQELLRSLCSNTGKSIYIKFNKISFAGILQNALAGKIHRLENIIKVTSGSNKETAMVVDELTTN